MARLTNVRRLLLLAALGSLILSGCIFQIQDYTLDCEGIRIIVDYIQPNVDNTGLGAEIVVIRAFDGAGNLLFDPLPPDLIAMPIGTAPGPGDPVWDMIRGLFSTPLPWQYAPQYNPLTITLTNPAGGVLAHDVELLRLTGECPGLPWADGQGINDGRLNGRDMAAPVAIYPVPYASGMGLHIYAIAADGTGSLVLEVTPEMIAAVPNPPAENTLIAATPDGSIAFYRLTTGEFQINAGTYVIVFSDLTPTADYYTP